MATKVLPQTTEQQNELTVKMSFIKQNDKQSFVKIMSLIEKTYDGCVRNQKLADIWE